MHRQFDIVDKTAFIYLAILKELIEFGKRVTILLEFNNKREALFFYLDLFFFLNFILNLLIKSFKVENKINIF